MSVNASKAQTVLITGCSTGGIGHAFAKLCHDRGMRVFATSRSIDTMQTLRDIGIETLPLDVADTVSIRAAKEVISKRTGGSLDILINNAGIAYASAASDISMEQVRKLFEVNFFGIMTMVQEFLPLLMASTKPCIVQIASLAGLMPVPFNCAYNASKAALLSYGDTLRVELAPFGIKVLNVAAGNVESNIMKGSPESLPPDSIYSPINAEFVHNRIEHFQDGATPVNQFVTTVLDEALKSNPRAWLYTANNSWTVWILSTFAGRKGFDKILSDLFGLSKLAKIKKSEKKAVL